MERLLNYTQICHFWQLLLFFHFYYLCYYLIKDYALKEHKNAKCANIVNTANFG